MKKLKKHKVIFLTLLMFICTESIAADRILPLPKPEVGKEIKKKLLKSKNIYPAKKPKFEKKEVTADEEQELVNNIIDDENENFIYPQKKPIIVKKIVEKKVEKSAIFSKRDFDIAKTALAAVDKKSGKQH